MFALGDVAFHGSAEGLRLSAPIVGIVASSFGRGYWLVAADGGVFTIGDAQYVGSTGGMHLNAPIVGMATSQSEFGGYWLVAADGGVSALGDAEFLGATAGRRLARPVRGIEPFAQGVGYLSRPTEGSSLLGREVPSGIWRSAFPLDGGDAAAGYAYRTTASWRLPTVGYAVCGRRSRFRDRASVRTTGAIACCTRQGPSRRAEGVYPVIK